MELTNEQKKQLLTEKIAKNNQNIINAKQSIQAIAVRRVHNQRTGIDFMSLHVDGNVFEISKTRVIEALKETIYTSEELNKFYQAELSSL